MAIITGEVTSDRASLTICLPTALCSRADGIELAGIHSAGRPPSSAGHVPVRPLMTASESPTVTVTFTHLSPTGEASAL